MRKYFSVSEIVEKKISFDFYSMISRVINLDISFEMNEVLPYLVNYAYLQICGALEKKIDVCQYYLMSINYDYAYKHKLVSIYAPDKLLDFFSDIDEYFDIGITENNINKQNFFYKFIYNYKIDGKLIYDLTINDMEEYFGSNNQNSAILSYFEKQYCDFKYYWTNLKYCVEEAKTYYSDIKDHETFLKKLYKKIWEYRHVIAHNLNSLYCDEFGDSIYLNNYFFKIALLLNIDTILIDVMKNKIDKKII